MSAHMKEGMQAHLSLLSLVVPTLQTLVHQQGDLMKQMRDQIKQDRDQIKQQVDQMENRIKQLEKQFPPVDIIMDDFEQHKRSDDIWYSPPFYTHLGGYRMCLGGVANGYDEGKGTHVSVHVHLMRGEYDDLLKWPFRGEVTIQLKKNNPPHHQLIRSFDNATPETSVSANQLKRGTQVGDIFNTYPTLICMLVDT